MKLVPAGLAVLILSSQSFALSVEEAYQAIPHQRTVFQAAESSMPGAESGYLTQLFDAVDLAIVAKVAMARGASKDESYQPVWDAWKKLSPPSKLKRTQDLFRQAIENEEAALVASHGRVDSSDSRTSAASQALHEAYNQLLSLYPSENGTNKQAFFDYPCALDFF